MYFSENEQPFDTLILSAVAAFREGTTLSKGAAAKRMLALAALTMAGADARQFIKPMKLDSASERWRIEQRLRDCSAQFAVGNNLPISSVTHDVPRTSAAASSNGPAGATLPKDVPAPSRADKSANGPGVLHNIVHALRSMATTSAVDESDINK